MSNLPYYFIAIPLNQKLRDEFSTWQIELKDKIPLKQWPHKQDLHITLKFLGPVAENQLQHLQNELMKLEREVSPFNTNVGTIGTFGNPQMPRVLWAGVEKTDALASLQQIIEDGGMRAGFQKEGREYRPHITLAKKWGGDSKLHVDFFQEIKMSYNYQQNLLVDQIVIYQIFPARKQKYEVIQAYKLTASH